MNAYTLEEAESRLYEIYQWFHREAPDVVVQEAGEVGDLWRIVDDFLRVVD